MRLPNADRAMVDREKITGYLLNAAHPENGGKAAFFEALGFTLAAWGAFAAALRAQGARSEVSESIASKHGSKYVIEGPIETPSGRSPTVRSVWIVDRGLGAPRLVRAYPAGE